MLPSGYQFLTTIAQTITGAKTFSSSVNTSGIVDNLSISTHLLTLSNSISFNDANGGTTFNASFAQLNNNFICTIANTGNAAIWYMFGLAQPVLMTISSAGLLVNYLLTCQSGLTVNGVINALSTLNVSGDTTLNATIINGPLLVSTINRIDKTAPLIIYSGTVPLPTAGTGSGAGLMLGWNSTLGGGECDLISMGQSGAGGFNFYTSNVAIAPCSLLMSLNGYALTIAPQMSTNSITSAGIITIDHFVATNSSATSNFWNMSASTISTTNILVNANATIIGTSTFSGPTVFNQPLTAPPATLTTQLATLGQVNTAVSATSFSSVSGSTQVNYTVDTSNTINITGISNQNFFTTAGLPTNNYILIEYKFIQFDNLLATIYSSTGTLMLFPQRIGSYTGSGQFGQYSQPTLYKQYNINNGINGNTAFNDVNATYSPNNRQYWNCCPAGGQNSGFSTTPTSFYINGSTTSGDVAGGGNASYGFTMTPISSTTTFNYNLSFNVIYNPFPSTIVINNYLNSKSQHL